jgi:signal transduction histidine kinase
MSCVSGVFIGDYGASDQLGLLPTTSPSQAEGRRRLGVILASLVLVAVALTAAVVALTRAEWVPRVRNPGQPLAWSIGEWAYFCAGWCSVLLGQLAGLWLWWRAPRNATGRWLWLAGFSLGVWFVGDYWPDAWAMELQWAIVVMRPALAMAILGWPTGRPGRTAVRWIMAVTAAVVAKVAVVTLFSRPSKPGTWPVDPIARFSVDWVAPVASGVTGWLLFFLPAAAVVVVLVRRRRSLPRGARRLLTPITITGAVVAGSDMVNIVVYTFAQNLTWDDKVNHATVLGTVNFVQNYAQVAVAAVGLLVAFGYRQRAVRASDHRLDLELGPASSIDVSVALTRLLGDASARVLYRRPRGVWVDAEGCAAHSDLPHRVLTPIEGRDGSTLAAIETDARVGAHPSLIEIGAAAIATSLANERASAIAHARSAELAALQLALLDAIDSTRLRLERDLHDGAQQRLVGATLAASLAARHGDRAALEPLRAEIGAAKAALVDVLEDRVPPVLRNGLAAALATLAATAPLDAEAEVRGDLDPADPLARTMWLVANEAAANTIKHANASLLRIVLAVDASNATLRVTDNGCGGVTVPPRTVASRVEEAGGAISVSSPVGEGTDLFVIFDRAGTMVAA